MKRTHLTRLAALLLAPMAALQAVEAPMPAKLRGFKRGMYEGALRQAAIARWPGTIPAGHVSDEPWAFWDFLPTAAEMAGVALPAGLHVDGLSLVSFFKGGAALKRDYFYWELHEGRFIQALRFGEWKAVRNGPGKTLELYDLKTDPAEAKDLAADRFYDSVVCVSLSLRRIATRALIVVRSLPCQRRNRSYTIPHTESTDK